MGLLVVSRPVPAPPLACGTPEILRQCAAAVAACPADPRGMPAMVASRAVAPVRIGSRHRPLRQAFRDFGAWRPA
jgi:hypothetical protein